MDTLAKVEKQDATKTLLAARSPSTAVSVSLMLGSFLVAILTSAIVLATFGVGEHGTVIALRVTARWSFLLFWPAYTGRAIESLFGSRAAGFARRSRDFGLAYALAQLVHVGLVCWLIFVLPALRSGMLFFWIGIVCTYLLALNSIPRVQKAFAPRLCRALCTIAIEYIALVFAADFILLQLQGGAPGKYWVLTYLPFAILLIVGIGLRVAAYAWQLLNSMSNSHG